MSFEAVPKHIYEYPQRELGLAVHTDCDRFLDARLAVLQEQLATAERLAAANELPELASLRGFSQSLDQADVEKIRELFAEVDPQELLENGVLKAISGD